MSFYFLVLYEFTCLFPSPDSTCNIPTGTFYNEPHNHLYFGETMLSLLLYSSIAHAENPTIQSQINSSDQNVRFEATWEIGSIGVFSHTYKSGSDATDFDFVEDGGQDNLFPFQRFEVNFLVKNRHNFLLLYQPLNLVTTQEASSDIQMNNVTFPAGTPMDYRYGFDFIRGTWNYDIKPSLDKELSFGGGIQMRNATIDFTSADGTIRNSNRNIGPVPVITSRGHFNLGKQRWWGFDFAGAFAPIKYINGSNSDVVGALVDTSLRTGIRLKNGVNTFINLRYISGGSEGTNSNPDEGKDGFSENWVHFGAVSVGFWLR